jgi:hypothetical protein
MKSCFIIPVYPPHYSYLSFLNELPDNLEFDVYLVLSFSRDLEDLDRCNYKKIYKTIVLEDHLDHSFINEIINKNVIITFKKYYALNTLKEKYEYLATCDSEIKFINTDKVDLKFKRFCDSKTIIGSVLSENSKNINLAKDINRYSCVFFDTLASSNVTEDFRFYFWFSDIPIYDSSILKRYLDFIKFEDFSNFVNKINWHFFDYIPYGIYCLMYEDYRKINILDFNINRNWSLESMPFDMYIEVLKTGYSPLWLIHNTWSENKEKVSDDVIMVYHMNNGRYTSL